MKHYIYTLTISCTSLLFSLESGNDSVVNEKFKFVQEIYTNSFALIIGINEYENVEPLIYAVPDAESVKEMFVEKYGFKEENIRLILDEDATKDNILDAFSDILQLAKEKDRVVVFYAGHGETYKLPSGGDMGYLIPVDGNLDNLYRSSIPMKSIYDIAEMSYAKHILYLVDACYGGLTLNTRGLKKDTTPEYLKKMTRERGRQVITAGGKDEMVIEKPEWGHSAFTRNLLKGLGDELADENSDGIITADELGGFIRNRVPVDSDGAHTPQRGRIGSDMGEFVFISETMDEQLAYAFPESKQMTAMELKMAELEKMISQQNDSGVKKKKVNNSMRIKKASRKAWGFPGRGHFYKGQTGKGIMFASLELASLAGLTVFGLQYANESDQYNVANQQYDDLKANLYSASSADLDNKYQEIVDASSARQQALFGMIGTGTTAALIWIWNIKDVKKTSYSQSTESKIPLSVGLNYQGHIQLRIAF